MRKIRAVSHFWNREETRLTVIDLRGDAVSFPRMDRRKMTLYSDYRTFKQELEPIKAQEVFHEEAAPEYVMPIIPIPNGLDHSEVAHANGG